MPCYLHSPGISQLVIHHENGIGKAEEQAQMVKESTCTIEKWDAQTTALNP